jgi:hypothetical protein
MTLSTYARMGLALAAFSILMYIWITYGRTIEGMESGTGPGPTPTATVSGVGGGSEAYATHIKNQVIHLQDTLLVDKYRDKYESIVVSLDDLINNAMLSTALNIDPRNPNKQFEALATMNQSKAALNVIMKFIAN